MQKTALIIIVFSFVIGEGVTKETAQAHMLSGKRNLAYANRSIQHARNTISWVTNHKPLYTKLGHMREYGIALRDHHWLLAWAKQLQAKLRPRPRSKPHVDSCLSTLIGRESGWRWWATNPVTGAYGLPQALPGSKMASAGSDWRTNPATQIRWMLGYITKYGGSCGALSFQMANGWY